MANECYFTKKKSIIDHKKKDLSEVGFEPTPSCEDQNSLILWQDKYFTWVWRLRPLGHPDTCNTKIILKKYFKIFLNYYFDDVLITGTYLERYQVIQLFSGKTVNKLWHYSVIIIVNYVNILTFRRIYRHSYLIYQTHKSDRDSSCAWSPSP